MSSFQPLNQLEDTTVSKTEHTKELQVEKAFKIFDEVLKLQKKGEIHECYKLYESLFKLKVISGHYDDEGLFIKGLQNGGSNTIADELNFVSSNLKTLRYLIFRNRAFFYLDILKSDISLGNIRKSDLREQLLDFEVGKELFYSLLDDMGNALYYQEADNNLIHVLTDLLLFLKSYRLTRFALEYALSSKKESDDILGLLPLDKLFGLKYNMLVQMINFDEKFNKTVFEKEMKNIEEKYQYLKPYRDDFWLLIDSTTIPREQVCKIKLKGETVKWENLTHSINEMVKRNEDKSRIETTSRLKLKDIDPYFFTTSSVDILKLEIPNADSDVEVIEEYYNVDDSDADNNADNNADDEVHVVASVEGSNNSKQPQVPEANDDMIIDNDSTDARNINDETITIRDQSVEVTPLDQQQIPCDVSTTTVPVDTSNRDQDDHESIKEVSPVVNSEKEFGQLEIISEKQVSSKPDSDIAKRNAQRVSKRLQKNDLDSSYWYPDVEVTSEMFAETKTFFHDLNRFLEALDSNHSYSLNDITAQFTNPESNPQYMQDFILLLNDFDPPLYGPAFLEAKRVKNARLLENDDVENQRLKLLDVLKSFSNSESNYVSLSSVEEMYPESSILEFINQINESKCHLNDVKIRILRNLLEVQPNNMSSICDVDLPTALLYDIRIWVIQLEEQLIQESITVLSKKIKGETLKDLAFTVGVYELLVDSYIQQKTKIDTTISQNVRTGFQKSFKGSLNTQISSLSKMRNVLDRWASHIQATIFSLEDFLLKEPLGFKSYVRFKWAAIYKVKADNSNFRLSQYVITELAELENLINENDKNLVIGMPNYKQIRSLDLNSISLLSNAVVVLTMFDKILNSQMGGLNQLEAIGILERTLISSDYFDEIPSALDKQAIYSVKQLLAQSSTDMKYNLWTILFQYYSTSADLRQFQFGFERVVETILDDLTSENYIQSDYRERRTSLVRILCLFDEYLVMFTDCLSGSCWKLDLSNKKSVNDTLSRLMRLFEFCYMFSLHEEAALLTSRKTSVTEKSKSSYSTFMNILIKIVTVMVVYYDACISIIKSNDSNIVNEITLDLLSLVHDQLGFRRLCDAGDGIFLRMFQDVLVESNINKRQNDALQLLYCRNHCKISSSEFTPNSHETVATEHISKDSVYRISKFVLPLCLDKSPLENPPKGDLKSIIDKFYEVVGKPEYESGSILDKNSKILTEFLSNTRITPIFTRECFYGLHSISFFPIEDDETVSIIQDGLYYLEALLMLQSFKVRRAAGSGKSLEVVNAVELLKFDLLYGSSRVESWLLLGEAYGFLVEDDLLWTPDKLSVAEKKAITGNVQRKSLLCYLMAINFSKSAKPKDIKAAIPELMSNFSKEFFNSCMIPMEMTALKTIDSPLFLQNDHETKMVNTTEKPTINKTFCLKIIQQTLHLAIKSNKEDCVNYYLLGKVQSKLGLPVNTVVDTLKISCDLSYKTGASNIQDIVIEPHYKLCSIIYKAVKSDKLSLTEASKILQDDIIFKAAEFQGSTKEDFYNYVIKCLKQIVSFDKRKWQHKYHYRIAKIYSEDLHNVKAAIEEMSCLVTTKPTSKSLVQFWKPDIERPGKHFFYAFQYVSYFIELLLKEKNLDILCIMYPRLRKSMAVMISLNVVWEQLCSSICKIVRWAFDVKDSFTESFLNTPSNLFWAHMKVVGERLKGSEIPENIQPALHLLNILSDIKKHNNGFGPTSLIDDTIVAVFINIYYSIPQENAEPAESQAGKFKKLAKKDIFPCTADILKNSKREMDKIYKDKPNILNEFITYCERKYQPKELPKESNEDDNKETESSTNPPVTPSPEDPQVVGANNSDSSSKIDDPRNTISTSPELHEPETFYTPKQGDGTTMIVVNSPRDTPSKENYYEEKQSVIGIEEQPSNVQNKRQAEEEKEESVTKKLRTSE